MNEGSTNFRSTEERRYATLSRVEPDVVELAVESGIQRTWTRRAPEESLDQLFQRCLTWLSHEGWRPISHHNAGAAGVVLARVPYPAGARLSTFGVLRFVDADCLVLSVSGSTMRRWDGDTRERLLDRAIQELHREGWMVHRRYSRGATVVRA